MFATDLPDINPTAITTIKIPVGLTYQWYYQAVVIRVAEQVHWRQNRIDKSGK
jgi:hypothetical protein